ncbi:MAG: Jag N-terminal domain-containing protein, partial [Ruthenibacterium sp.]
MREVITTGKTVEDAVADALVQLGLTEDEVTVEVLDLPQKKLFKTIPARVRVIC